MVEVKSNLREDRSFLVPPAVEGRRFVQHYIRHGLNQIDSNDFMLMSAIDGFQALVEDGSFEVIDAVKVEVKEEMPIVDARVDSEVIPVFESVVLQGKKRGRPAKHEQAEETPVEENLNIDIS